MDLWLGGQLPRQLPNPPQSHPKAATLAWCAPFENGNIPVSRSDDALAPVSRD